MTAEAHTSRAHAKLAPSSSHRWMECPGSIVLSADFPNTSSIFAAEGTAAHELCSHCLETGDDPATFSEMWVDIRPEEGKPRFVDLDEKPSGDDIMRYFEVDDDMVDGVQMYVDHVRSLIKAEPGKEGDDWMMSVEQRLDMTHIHPEIFGTGDAAVLDVQGKHLHIIDFKYGKGVLVEVDNNPQLLLYAAGTLRRYHNHAVNKMTIWVVQPRMFHPRGRVRSYEIDLIDLIEFETDIAKAAARTDDAEKTFNAAMPMPWPDVHLKAGEWCGFCPAQPICPARRKQAFADALVEFDIFDLDEPKFMEPSEMTNEQRGKVLRAADNLHAYVKAVQQFEHDRAMNGDMPDGCKLVAKRATRKWKDETAAIEVLEVLGVSKNEMFEEPKFKTPAKLEGLFPGKNKGERQAAMEDLVDKKSSGFNLVLDTDHRPAVNLGAKAEFEALEGVE